MQKMSVASFAFLGLDINFPKYPECEAGGFIDYTMLKILFLDAIFLLSIINEINFVIYSIIYNIIINSMQWKKDIFL